MIRNSTFALTILVAMSSGCLVTTQQQAATQMTESYPFRNTPIPPRPPEPFYGSQAGVQAPFTNNVNNITVNNSVLFRGQKPLVITRLWVSGVEVPILHSVRMHDHVFTIAFLQLGGDQVVALPPSQFLDGSGEGKVRVVAQAASWMLDPMGRTIPSDNIVCIDDMIRVGEKEVLDWSHRMIGIITCPESSMAIK